MVWKWSKSCLRWLNNHWSRPMQMMAEPDTAGYSKWLQIDVDANECKWMQMDANGWKYPRCYKHLWCFLLAPSLSWFIHNPTRIPSQSHPSHHPSLTCLFNTHFSLLGPFRDACSTADIFICNDLLVVYQWSTGVIDCHRLPHTDWLEFFCIYIIQD